MDPRPKTKVYAREGVGHLWLVDPLAQALEVYRLEPAARAWLLVDTHAGTAPVRAVPFDAIELDLARWWIETG